MPLRRLVQVFVLYTFCLALSSCQGGQGAKPAESPSASAIPAVDVNVVRVKIGTIDNDISAVGNFRAVTEASISPKAGGMVVDVPVQIGQFVPQGAVLIQLDTRDIEAQLAQDRADINTEQTRLGLSGVDQTLRSPHTAPAVRKAKATLDNKRLEWERSRNLYRADLVAQKDLQDAKAQYLAAQADYQTSLETVRTNQATVTYKRTQLAMDQQKLANTTVRAPFSGYVGSRNVNPGDFIQPGGSATSSNGSTAEYMKLMTINPIYCSIEIPEMYSQKLRVGQTLAIKTVSYPGKIFNGRVAHVSPALDPATRTARVEATINNAEKLLRPGFYGNVHLTLGQTRNVRLVPQVAQIEQAGLTRLYLVQDLKNGEGVAKIITITRGKLQGNWVQAEASALGPSSIVIVSNLDKLYDGAKVKVDKTLTEPPAVPHPGE